MAYTFNMKPTKYGACTLSRNVVETNSIKYCVHSTPHKDIDSGWIFMADNDISESCSTASDWVIRTLEDAMKIEPIIAHILQYPVGCEFTIERHCRHVNIIDCTTGLVIYSCGDNG